MSLDENISSRKRWGGAGVRFLAVVGALLLVGMYAALTAVDIHDVRQLTEETLAFAGRHISYYQETLATRRAEALRNLNDKSRGLQKMLTEQGGVLTGSDLRAYARSQCVNGVLVLDETLTPVYQYDANSLTAEDWADELSGQDVRDVLENPRKHYMACVEKNGSSYDMVVTARSDAEGVIIVYAKRTALELNSQNNELGRLFEGYSLRKSGSIILIEEPDLGEDDMSEEEEVLISDQQEDADGVTDFICDFEHYRFGMLTCRLDNVLCYGGVTSTGGYTVCAFFPYTAVFRQRTTVILSMLALYVILVLLFYLVRSREQEKTLATLQKQYQVISTVGRIFGSIIQYDIKDDTLEVLAGPDYLVESSKNSTSAEDTVNSWVKDYIVPEDFEKHKAFVCRATVPERLAATGQTEIRYQLKSGNWCQGIMLTQHTDENGVPDSVIVVTRDITDEIQHDVAVNKRLQAVADEARRANAAKTDFLRRMSHDIRTPINGIRGMVEIGDHFPEDMEKQADCRKKIWQASDFLLDLVNNVLDMNKLESGELKPEKVPFALQEVSHEVHTILQPQAEEHGLSLSSSGVDLKHTRLIGSPLYLRQVLINLGGNAVKYNRPGGSVKVGVRELSADENEARYLFTVEDTGLGMSKEFQQRLFEPFAQENIAARSTYTGTGLGLAITKELVEKMGGTIRFESKQGEGTRFEVEIPFLLDKTPAPEQKKLSPEECSLKGMHVLLVEDNELNREIARFILENEEMVVDEAENGREAVDKFAASQPGAYDVILMDIMMPVMDGLAASRAIRALNRPDAASVPIFAMTANAFSDDIAASRAAGMNEHLAKPLDSAKLVEKLRLYRWHENQK